MNDEDGNFASYHYIGLASTGKWSHLYGLWARPEGISFRKSVKGEVFVSGISNEEFASTLRCISYPFTGGYRKRLFSQAAPFVTRLS